MRWSGRHRSGGPLAAAVVAVAALLVVLALAAGPVDVQEPGWFSGGDLADDIAPVEPPPTAEPAPTEEPVLDPTPSIDVPWQLVVLVAIVAAGYLAYYLLRRVLPGLRLRAARRQALVGGQVEALPDPVEELLDGARSAASALSGPAPDAAAAVIAAWLALESAAAGGGAARDPAQTPTEFTTALLRRHHADPAAVTTLLGLYHRARFAVRPDLDAEDVAAARRAVELVVGTLGAAAGTVGPGGG